MGLSEKLGEKGVFQGSLFYDGLPGGWESGCFRNAVAAAVFTYEFIFQD
jgi:hypothetical protein